MTRIVAWFVIMTGGPHLRKPPASTNTPLAVHDDSFGGSRERVLASGSHRCWSQARRKG